MINFVLRIHHPPCFRQQNPIGPTLDCFRHHNPIPTIDIVIRIKHTRLFTSSEFNIHDCFPHRNITHMIFVAIEIQQQRLLSSITVGFFIRIHQLSVGIFIRTNTRDCFLIKIHHSRFGLCAAARNHLVVRSVILHHCRYHSSRNNCDIYF